MNKKLLMALPIAGMMLLSGCATIIDGKTQKINLISSKEKKVKIDGIAYNSPSVITIDRPEKDSVLHIEDCNKDILMKKKINNTFFVNILSGGAFGSSTDYGSNSMWEYENSNVNVDCN